MGNIVQMILAGIAIYATIGFIWYVIMVIADWRIFSKAGEAGWKSLIPILNGYVLFKLSWNGNMFWIMLLTLFGGSACTAKAGEEGGILSIIGLVLTIAGLLIALIDVHMLSKSFGHGIGFTLGLMFLNPLFTLILAYGGSKYIGPAGKERTIPM